MDSRPSKAYYLLNMAIQTATRSTCLKKCIGCVLTDADYRVVATGYNGSLPHEAHCTDVGCLLNDNKDCIRTIHAEINALANCNGNPTIAWLTDEPCLDCLKALLVFGIKQIIFIRFSDKPDRNEFVRRLDLQKMFYSFIACVEGQEKENIKEVMKCLDRTTRV